jgi:hypothetical protein
LDVARSPIEPSAVDFRELSDLPAPVQRYFRTVLTDGQPMVTGVRVRHTGMFNMGETKDAWKPSTSDQKVVAQRPGFDWDGRIAMMPGLPVRVHDAYIAGEGILHASLLGLFSLAIETVQADARGRMVSGTIVPTPWQGRFWNHKGGIGCVRIHFRCYLLVCATLQA